MIIHLVIHELWKLWEQESCSTSSKILIKESKQMEQVSSLFFSFKLYFTSLWASFKVKIYFDKSKNNLIETKITKVISNLKEFSKIGDQSMNG